MKYCRICNTSKSKERFSKDKYNKQGLHSKCKSCDKRYYEQNKEMLKPAQKQWVKENKERVAIKVKQWKQDNSHRVNASNSKYRAAKLNAAPKWVTKEHFKDIEQYYEVAKEFTEATGEPFHVDHIVPLQGKNVCGLHVSWNLQILEALENIKKGNKQ